MARPRSAAPERAQPAGLAAPEVDEVVARYYDLEHDPLVADAALYAQLAREGAGQVLELGCGTGRIVHALSRAGSPVVGVDRSAPMLARARARLGGAVDLRGRWRLEQSDARTLTLPEQFTLVLAPLDFLGYFPATADQLAVLDTARRHLQPGGRLVVDVTFPCPAFFAQPEGVAVHQWTRTTATSETVSKWWVREIDPVRQVLHLTAFYDVSAPDGSQRRWTYPLDLRYFHRFELELLLQQAGFAVESVHGGYALEDLHGGSTRLVVVARR